MNRNNRARPNERASFDMWSLTPPLADQSFVTDKRPLYVNVEDMEVTLKNFVIFPDVTDIQQRDYQTKSKCYQYFGIFKVSVEAQYAPGLFRLVTKVAERFCSKGHNSISLPPMFVKPQEVVTLEVFIYRVLIPYDVVDEANDRIFNNSVIFDDFTAQTVHMGLGWKYDAYMGHQEEDN